ncbi:hypothetical protein GQ457_07G011290 [Hibiscus cannabinus]
MLAETFRSLSNFRKKGGGNFVGCAQLLTVWFHNHYGEKPKPTLHAFTDEYSPLGEFLEKKLPNFTKDKWIAILRNLRDEDVKWYVSWLPRLDILYKCGGYDWVPLSGIWGSTGYAPLMVQRQYGSVQFIPVTAGLDLADFSYKLRNVEKERDQLAEDFTDLQASHQKIQGKLKVAGMRKTTEEWERELREQEMEAGRYKKLFLAKEKDFRSLLQDMQRLQQQNQELKNVVSELEESLQNQYQSASKKLKVAQEENRNYKNLVVALENSLQEYKQLIIDLRAAVKADRDQWNLTLKITRAEVLKLKVGSTSHCGKELTRFLDEIEKLGVRAGLYFHSFALI